MQSVVKRAQRAFQEHPASVGESYWQHMGQAFSFGARMLTASLACFLHGILPFLFTSTGSRTIAGLHDRMVTNRIKTGAQMNSCELNDVERAAGIEPNASILERTRSATELRPHDYQI